MTRQEFIDKIVRRVSANWPHSPWPNATIAKVYDEVREFPADQVLAAVEALYRDGERFAPSGGMILGKLADLTDDAPDWGEAWAVLRRALRHSVVYDLPRVRAELEQAHPAIRQFAEEVGLRSLPDVSADAAAFAQARERYRAIVGRRRRDLTYRGIPAAGLPALERVQRAPARIGAAVHAAAGLPAPGEAA